MRPTNAIREVTLLSSSSSSSSGMYLLLLLVIASPATVHAQKTYSRSCDCEYMVDGKCAYTILLPVGQTSTGGDVTTGCDVTQVADSVRSVANNVSFLWQWTANQSAALGQLQQALIALQSNVIAAAGSACPTPVPGSPTGGDDVLASINRTLADHAKSLASFRVAVDNVTVSVDSLRGQVAGLRSELTALERNLSASVGRVMSRLDRVERLASSCVAMSRMFSGPSRLNASTTAVRVSSVYDNTFSGANVNLDAPAWCPSEPNGNEWIEFDIDTERWVYGVITRGRDEYPQWVTSYQLKYHVVGADNTTTSDTNSTAFWTTYTDAVDINQVFTGNTDQSTAQINMLWKPIYTRFVRIVPLTANNNSNKCMRADIIGCVDSSV